MRRDRIAATVAILAGAVLGAALGLSGCGKTGLTGAIAQNLGSWAEIKLPPGCRVRQIAAESGSGVAVLCEDGRLFH